MDERPEARSDDPAYYQGLGRAIQVARTELGLSRRDLAARTGVSYTYLADIENGRRRPSSAPLLAISRALGMSPSELLARAEVYYARGTGRPFVATAFEEDLGERLERPAAMSSAPLAGPSRVRERAAGLRPEPEEPLRRALHELIDRLSPSDLRVVHELVRRITRR